MAKLTVFFKDKPIHTSLFEKGMVRIGRDETNDITIDSLAIAPAHAVVIIREDSCSIKQLNYDFPLILNGVKIKAATVKDNDTVSLGKHVIVFNLDEAQTPPASIAESTEVNLNLLKSNSKQNPLPAGNFQILDGNDIGKIIPIRKTILQIGHNGNGMVAISKRKDGYFVSILENKGTITLNNQVIDNDSIKLHDNDILVINKRSLQFFLS